MPHSDGIQLAMDAFMDVLRMEFAGPIRTNGPTTNIMLQVKARMRKFIDANGLQGVIKPVVKINDESVGLIIGFEVIE